jgi:hypothetical protein
MPGKEKDNRIQLIKYAPPPADLPVYGKSDPRETSFIGRTNYVAALETKNFIFGVKRVDRRRHIYAIGKSGVGKSKLFELLMRQDIAYGHGLCFIDPYGETIDDILPFIPENRIEDVCLIDPTDTASPVSFNPFVGVEDDAKHQLVQELAEIMEQRFGANWTPRLEHVFRFACSALLDYPRASFMDLIPLLSDAGHRKEIASHAKDPIVRRFWLEEFEGWAEKFDGESILPLMNKFGQFFSNPMLRGILGQLENKIDFDDLIAGKRIVLINLAKGRMGEDNANFLGALFLAKLKEAGMARVSQSRDARHDFYVYLDEFQGLVTDTFESFLPEARKYGLCLMLAHQYVSQLSPKVHAGILGSAGTIVIFRVGGEDALKLKPEMAPVFDVKDMINLGTGQMYLKMMIDGETYDPFSAETLKVLPPTHPSHADRIIASSRAKYALHSAANA